MNIRKEIRKSLREQSFGEQKRLDDLKATRKELWSLFNGPQNEIESLYDTIQYIQMRLAPYVDKDFDSERYFSIDESSRSTLERVARFFIEFESKIDWAAQRFDIVSAELSDRVKKLESERKDFDREEDLARGD